MKTKNLFSLALLCGCLFFASNSFSQKVVEANPEFAASIMGRLDGRIYSNQVLKFEVKLPDDGVILNQAEADVYKNAGMDALKNGDSRNNARLEAATKKELILINYAKKPIGSPNNSLFIVTALKQNAGVTGSAVIAATLSSLKSTGKFELSKSLSRVSIGNTRVDGLEGVLTVNGSIKIKQRVLVFMRNGYSISIGITGMDDESLNETQGVLSDFKFLAK